MLNLVNSLGIQSDGRIQYDPAQIATHDKDASLTLTGWFDFNDGSTIFEDTGGTDAAEDGDNIARINNKAYDGLGASSASINEFASQGTAGARPVWTAPSGLNAGYATFADDVLESSVLQGNASTGRMGGVNFNPQGFTFMAVVKGNPTGITGPAEPIFTFTDRTRSDSGLEYGASALGNDIVFNFNTKMNTPFSTSTVRPNTDVTCITLTGGTSTSPTNSLKWYIDGDLENTDTTNYSAFGRDLTQNDPSVGFNIGWCFSLNRSVTKGWNGRIYEIVMYDKCLSDYQRHQLHRYVGTKYDISMTIS
tara:strand:+ start:772 stop:1692 length:921 start_codon:yes stop_codon:yes gene_type:complete